MKENKEYKNKQKYGKTSSNSLLDGVAWFFFIMLLILPSFIFSDPNMQNLQMYKNEFTIRVLMEMIVIPLGGAIGIGRLIVTKNKYFMIFFPNKYDILSQMFWYLKGLIAICVINVLITVLVFK